jgi:hypothetical protein
LYGQCFLGAAVANQAETRDKTFYLRSRSLDANVKDLL